MKMILASSSPRRHQLLARLNYPFEIILPNVDESLVETSSAPNKYCIALAKMKAYDISLNNPNALVIGADTIVFSDNQILNKPNNHNEAKQMLFLLSGKTHKVFTGIHLNWEEKKIHHSFSEISLVTFRQLDKKEINYYINGYSPIDKAGSYGIQDWSALFVKDIKGCYDNIVGFPLSRFYFELKKLGINLLDSNS